MTRATPALSRAPSKSRKPLELTEQELEAKVDDLRKRYPKLAINVQQVTFNGRVECFFVNVVHYPSRASAHRRLNPCESMELTRGVAFKVCALACQAVEEIRAVEDAK